MSLAYLNQDKDISDELPRDPRGRLGAGAGLMAVEQKYGKEKLLPLYTAMGTRIHIEEQDKSTAS